MMFLTSVVPAGMLFLAAMGHWDYGLLMPLRWMVTMFAALLAAAAFNQESMDWLGIMVIILFLFNPVKPIHFPLDALIMMDILGCSFFLAAGLELSRPGSS